MCCAWGAWRWLRWTCCRAFVRSWSKLGVDFSPFRQVPSRARASEIVSPLVRLRKYSVWSINIQKSVPSWGLLVFGGNVCRGYFGADGTLRKRVELS